MTRVIPAATGHRSASERERLEERSVLKRFATGTAASLAVAGEHVPMLFGRLLHGIEAITVMPALADDA
jgi:hypothetical protein